ncbi:IS3 family transposase [Acetobacter conturbans]|uniref:IS3 family transposase n=1 Tax=Acetobacter conturbans TaxID=1737472 RepID=A0ABX0K6Z5_9PROT|nr:IS3 family transposase [Acetobacter conturbans]NHN90153.1 IS3 family transposase [Acetobacter conturbans]
MGKVTRKRYSGEFKSRVALEAIRGEQTLAELASKHGVHQTMIAQWKRQAIEGMASLFSGNAASEATASPADVEKLHAKIGQLLVERGFFARCLCSVGRDQRRQMIDLKRPRLSVVRQCTLLQLNRSGVYYRPMPESEANLELMRLIDAQFLETPYYGSRQMTRHLRRLGHDVGRKRARRLMARMGLRAIYQKPRTTVPHPAHRKYPYLLRDLVIDRPNQVWCSDITYIPMRKGFLYLVAVMDWHTRKVLSWRLSNTMDAEFCVDALRDALVRYGTPQIFNTDQGSQFTTPRFTEVLERRQVCISMDGRGRWLDNVFIERLWRSLKYECVYLHAFETGSELRAGLAGWIAHYNEQRPHSALAGRTPDEAYHDVPTPSGPGLTPDQMANSSAVRMAA